MYLTSLPKIAGKIPRMLLGVGFLFLFSEMLACSAAGNHGRGSEEWK